MRITGGEFGGRNLRVPNTDAIRPTQDRVREALFNILMPEMADADFLDLYAGSGAVGLEALSRGAARATFVEAERRHVAVLQANATACLGRANLARAEIVTSDVDAFLGRYTGSGFTIAFADPPYALGREKGCASVLQLLAARNVVRANGLFISEMTAAQRAEDSLGWDLLRDRTYGKTRLCIWRRLGETP